MSVSALETYRECPRQYFYGQCLRLPTETAAAMTFGNALHAALAQFNKHRRDHGALPPADRLVGWWRERLSDNGYESRRQFSQALARGEQYLRRYHAWERQQEAVCPGCTVELVEQTLKFTLDYDFVCRVDALLRHSDGSYEIVDYKSGKRSLNKTVKTASANSPDRSWQLGVYRLAWGAERPDATIKTTYCFLSHTDDSFGSPVDEFNARGENVISCIHSREALDLITGELRAAMEDIRTNHFEAQPRTAQTCEYCQFGQLCEVSRHAYR
jgi:RecB family exonuclease